MLILSIPRAADGNRTHDLFLTKEVLYQLSYSSDTVESGRWDSNPRHPAWKAGTLPLSYTRIPRVGGEGFEPPKGVARQIYSLVQ